ncbi:MAG: ribonuclease HII [Candidatus Caldarchaeum sp.]|uniref:Ribonuclease n=1 Tax=Caldiarchaeum subterraneum TaxID=311458 RepID=A0A7C5U4P3_CALS0
MAGKLVCGIDEAGRGCVIGPLVIAAFAAAPRDLRKLKDYGVADSKVLSPRRRLELFQIFKQHYRFEYVVIKPRKVSESLRVHGGMGLNEVEYMSIAELVKRFRPDVVYVDSPDRDVRKARSRIVSHVRHDVEVRCMVHGDSRNVLIAAASIVAKVMRDKKIEQLRKILGDFGSGYPSDPLTRKWLMENSSKPEYGKYVRHGWKTLDRLRQTTLDQF